MSVAAYETFDTDVLVVGAGGAGLRAAIAAAEAGSKVIVLGKSLLGKAHTVMAEGGMAAALGNVTSEDHWEVHFADTMKGGKLLNDWRMAEIHAREAPERVLELERWGAVFDRTRDGLIHQRPFGAHTYPRLAHIGDRTGLELIRTLQDRLVHHPGGLRPSRLGCGAFVRHGSPGPACTAPQSGYLPGQIRQLFFKVADLVLLLFYQQDEIPQRHRRAGNQQYVHRFSPSSGPWLRCGVGAAGLLRSRC